MPPVVLICSPQGAQDLLSRTDSRAERGETSVSHELSAVIGDNLLTMSHAEWLPRRRAIQPLFATRNVPQFAGHAAALAEEFAAIPFRCCGKPCACVRRRRHQAEWSCETSQLMAIGSRRALWR
jgi:hypothetical protein